MTTPHPFAALIRRLDAEASKAPWEVGGPYPGTSIIVRTDNGVGWPEPEPAAYDAIAVLDGRTVGIPDPAAKADASAIVTLRNAAREVAALVEAGESVVAAYDALVGGKPMPSYGSIDALRAALDALAAKAKEADRA